MSRRRAWFEANRASLFAKLPDGCANCRSGEYLEIHHIVPIALGGTNLLGNLVKLCAECHGKAHGRKGRTNIRVAQQAGIEKAKVSGKYQGRPQDTEKRERIKTLLAEGLSVRKVAAAAKCSPTTVQAVKNTMQSLKDSTNETDPSRSQELQETLGLRS